MQKLSKSQDTKLQEKANMPSCRRKDVLEDVHMDGEKVAQLFKYYRAWQNPYKKNIVPLKLVSGKKIYKKHKDLFDNFASLASKNNFDVDAYMKYCVISRGINERCIESALSSTTMLKEFYKHIMKKKKLEKIYKWFMKSIKNIVDDCLSRQTFTTIDYLRELIQENNIGLYVAAGKISLYYLAAIPSFNKVISHLDHFSKLELQLLSEHFEIYHSEVNEAFLEKHRKMVNPIEFTDLAILKALKQKSSKKI